MSKLNFLRFAALAVGLSLVAGTAYASAPSPVSIKIIHGPDGAGGTAELGGNDGTYFAVGSELANGPHTVEYIATFTGIARSGVSPTLRFIGHTTSDECFMSMQAYKWKKRKWVTWLDSAEIPEGPTDVTADGHADLLKPFVKDGKVKARIRCVSFGGPFTLRADHIGLIYSL